jgi:FdhE protein
VAETFLRRLFGGKASAPAADEARAEIDRALADRPTLAGPLGWLREVVDDLVPDPGYVTAELPDAETARAKLHAGVPLLRGLDLKVDTPAWARRWGRVCGALERHQPGSVPAGLMKTKLSAGGLARALIDDTTAAFEEIAEYVGDDPGHLAVVARFTAFAGFAALEEAAAPLRQGVIWERGCCPTCGSGPLLGEFRGLDQSRFLRCGLCAASWEVPRQWCPACGTRDHERLGFLSKEGEDSRYRAATCDACRTAVKTLNTLSALPPVMLLVADAATLHLDLAAADRGYGV